MTTRLCQGLSSATTPAHWHLTTSPFNWFEATRQPESAAKFKPETMQLTRTSSSARPQHSTRRPHTMTVTHNNVVQQNAARSTVVAAAASSASIPEDVAPLFTPATVGSHQLKHRMVLAPLTRSRAINAVPVPEMATYYTQRATDGGLMIAEGTCISQESHGYPHTPGIYTPDQLEAWKPVVKAVKDRAAVFFCQLWHCGRASAADYQPGNAAPIGPSAIRISDAWDVYTSKGAEKYPVPRALETSEIPGIIEQYVQAARNAIEVGFDGVEIHGANGYLLDQFLKPSSNTRTDQYGGSIENRARLHIEVAKACAEAIGADRVGIRLTPFNVFLDATDDKPYDTNLYLLKELNKLNLAYVHLVEPRVLGNMDKEDSPEESLAPFREAYKGTFIAAGGFKRESGAAAIQNGDADLVAYGRLWIANPDLPTRFIKNAPLNKYDRDTFYTQGMEGYIDYPTLEEVETKEKVPVTAAH